MSDYEIRPGDTLSKIAKKYGVTVKQLQEANGIKNPNLIFAGNNLKIPIEQDEAFDIPGLTIGKDNNPSSVKTLYGIPTPSGSTPTVPSGDARTLYAHITPSEPSGSDTPKITPTGDGKIVPLYGIPTPSGATPTVPTGDARTLYAHITPSEPSGSDTPKITPTGDGKIVPLYGIPTPSGSDTPRIIPTNTPTGDAKLLYAFITPSDTIIAPKPTPPGKTPAPAKSKPLTDAEKKEIDTAGKFVARYLAGYTTDVEQEAIVNNINKINNRNVLEFLQSYTNHRKDEFVHAEPFFSQVLHEYGFSEKQDIMHKTALRLAARLANDGNTADAAAVKKILAHKEFSEKDAKALDAIYTKYME